MFHVHTPGLRIHHRAAGSGKVALVLIHGNFASSQWWQPVLDRLAPGIAAYAPDLQGCGLTDKTLSGYGIRQLADDLLAFVNALELETFHLVGQSLGGAVALQLALDYSHRVESLLLMAPAPAAGLEAMQKGDTESNSRLQLVDPEHFPSRLTLYTLLQTASLYGLNRVLLRRALGKMIPDAKLDQATFDNLVEDAAQVSPAAVIGFFRALKRWNVEDRLPALEIPTTVLWGRNDSIVPVEGLEAMACRLPRGRLAVWPHVGHAPQFENPDKVARYIMDSIAECSPRSRARWLAWRFRKALVRHFSGFGRNCGQRTKPDLEVIETTPLAPYIY